VDPEESVAVAASRDTLTVDDLASEWRVAPTP
jgi:hypothetical protein